MSNNPQTGVSPYLEGHLLNDLPTASGLIPSVAWVRLIFSSYKIQIIQTLGVSDSGQFTLKYLDKESAEIQWDDDEDKIYDILNHASFLDGAIESVKHAKQPDRTLGKINEHPLRIIFKDKNRIPLKLGQNELVTHHTLDDVQAIPVITPHKADANKKILLVNRDRELYASKNSRIIFVKVGDEYRPLWVSTV